jgi:hypothetical protein
MLAINRDLADDERERLGFVFGSALEAGDWRLRRRNGDRYNGLDSLGRVQWTTGTGIEFRSRDDAEGAARALQFKAAAIRVVACPECRGTHEIREVDDVVVSDCAWAQRRNAPRHLSPAEETERGWP